MDSIANRMKSAMSNLKISQAELVKRTGIGKSSISTYLTGEYEPKQKNLYKIASALNVNEAWLMGLNVPMERKPATTDELVTLINSLDDNQQKNVIDYIQFLKSKKEYKL